MSLIVKLARFSTSFQLTYPFASGQNTCELVCELVMEGTEFEFDHLGRFSDGPGHTEDLAQLLGGTLVVILHSKFLKSDFWL